ncbi:MAG: ATP-binding protein [Bacteroidetes bacterium]|nr:ATP-binding protein [Bacteroidota bacterium]
MEQLSHYYGLVNYSTAKNAEHLAAELQWLEDVLQLRSDINSGAVAPGTELVSAIMPEFEGESAYAALCNELNLDFYERLLLMLALIPHVKPQILDLFLVNNARTGQIYTEFGGRKGKIHNGFLPTAETYMFIAASDDIGLRFRLQELLKPGHPLFARGVLDHTAPPPGEPMLGMPLTISPHFLELLTTGMVSEPAFSPEFPARRLLSNLDWKDLVVNDTTRTELEDLDTWLQYNQVLMQDWGMGKRLSPGFKALFFGPPGTGKTLAASLLGKRHNKPVFRIDLSQIISKYIGETGKNLARVFDRAEHRGWILFFDEADSLFGKRTQVGDSRDRYANQEVSYLLQRVEDYNGLVILASNFRNNMDEAFVRRFQSVIHFPMPGPAERLKLWTHGIPENARLESKVNLKELANKHELAGGHIMNVIRYACMRTLKRKSTEIRMADLIDGIRYELKKNGRTL